MKVVVTEFYMEPRINFDVSYKVYRFLRSCINSEINKIREVKQNPLELTLIIDARRIKKTKITPPLKFGRGSNEKKIIIYLPFSIKKENDFIVAFLTLFCEALNYIFPGYDVTEAALNKIEQRCMKEIPGNKKYEYKEEG